MLLRIGVRSTDSGEDEDEQVDDEDTSEKMVNDDEDVDDVDDGGKQSKKVFPFPVCRC